MFLYGTFRLAFVLPQYPNFAFVSVRLFRNVSKPRPSDHLSLIVFVIGGTTCTELRQIRDVVASCKSNIQVN